MVTKSVDIRRAKVTGNNGDGFMQELTGSEIQREQGGIRLVRSQTTVCVCRNVTRCTETETELTCDTGT